jgi:hypothetical protein
VPLASPLPALQLRTPSAQPAASSPSSTPSVQPEENFLVAVAPAGRATLRIFHLRTAWKRWTLRHARPRGEPRSALLACRASETRLRPAFSLLRPAHHAARMRDSARSLRRAWHLWLKYRTIASLRAWLSLRAADDATTSPPALPSASQLDPSAGMRGARLEDAAKGDSGWGAGAEAGAPTVTEGQSERPRAARACCEWARNAPAFCEHAGAAPPSAAPFERPIRPTIMIQSHAALQPPVSRASVTPPRYPCMRGGVPPAGHSVLESAVLTLRKLEPSFATLDVHMEAAARMARLRRGWRRWRWLGREREVARRLGRLGGRWGLLGKRLRLQGAWVGWAQYAAALRQAKRIASARRSLLKEEWTKWLASVQATRRAHLLSAAGGIRLLRSVFQRWACGRGWHSRRRHLSFRGRALLLSLRLRAWRVGADLRGIAVRLFVRAWRADPRQAQALHCWRDNKQRAAHSRRVRAQGIRNAARCCLARAWLVWHLCSEERRRLSLRLITPWSQRSLFFERWSLALQAASELGAKGELVLCRRRRVAFARWRREAAERQRLKTFSLPLRKGLPITAFWRWLRYAHQSIARQRLGSLSLQGRLQVACRLWRAISSARARLHPPRIPALMNLILVAFERWLAHSEAAYAEQRARSLRVLSKLDSSWRLWLRRASEQARLTQLHGRIRTSSLVAAMDQWSVHSDRLGDGHRLAALIAQTRRQAAWGQWRNYVGERAWLFQRRLPVLTWSSAEAFERWRVHSHALLAVDQRRLRTVRRTQGTMWRQWAAYASERAWLSQRRIPVLSWYTAEAFERWRGHSHTLLAEHRLSLLTVRRKQKAACKQWAEYASKRAWLVHPMLLKPTSLLDSSFARWMIHTDALLQEARLGFLIVRCRQLAALRQWLVRVRERTRLSQLLTPIHATFIPAALERWVEASAECAHLRYVGDKARSRCAWKTWLLHRRCAHQSAIAQRTALVASMRTRLFQWQASLLSLWQRTKMRWLCDEARLRARWRDWRRRSVRARRLASGWKAPRLRRACEKWRVHAALMRRACIEVLRANRHRLRRKGMGFPFEHACTDVHWVLKRWRSHACAGAQRGCAESWQVRIEGNGGNACGGGTVMHLLPRLELTAYSH